MTREATVLATFRRIEPLLTVLVWPLMLQLTLKTFARFEVSYVLCLVGEFTLFGLFRIIGVALGLTQRPAKVPSWAETGDHDQAR
jgi:hypothetical protein